uniref:Ycf34 n=1 Tax=Malaconema sp. TaxID=2575621 RepID=A0A4D6WV18_9FLOR|nr:hypothetical protein [Malaconema sp.]
MCICVNCRHMKKCELYMFIQKQHQNMNIINESINFLPIKTLLQVNINKGLNHTIIDWDLIECLSFVEQPGLWYEYDK